MRARSGLEFSSFELDRVVAIELKPMKSYCSTELLSSLLIKDSFEPCWGWEKAHRAFQILGSGYPESGRVPDPALAADVSKNLD